MNRIFGILLMIAALAQEMRGQDTTWLCGATSIIQHWGCTGADNFSASFNGVPETILYPGESGNLTVQCSNILQPPFVDENLFVIVNAIPQICAITGDSNNHPVIYFDSASLAGHNPLSLQREALIPTPYFQTIATINSSSSFVFVDTSVSTASKSQKYRIWSNDCDYYGTIHSTVYLQRNGNTLTWNRYGGQLLRGYYIYKRQGNGNFSVIDSVLTNSPTMSYTDPGLQFGDEYFVEGFHVTGCNPNLGMPLSIRSNTLRINSIVCNLTVTAAATPASCATCPDGSATANVLYGTAPFTYIWNSSPLQTTQTATGLISSNYAVCVIDSNGCAACDTVFVDSTMIVHDTCLVTLFDTTFITVYDTNTIDFYNDTVTVLLYDTIDFYNDTIVVTDYDTATVQVFDTTSISVYDTIAVTDTLYIHIPTGSNPPDASYTIKVYPNPTANQIYIDITEYWLIPGYTLKLINPLGQQVFSALVNTPGFAFDFSMFGSSGVYLLQFINNAQQVFMEKKIIRQ